MEMVIEGYIKQTESSSNIFTRMTIMINIIDTTTGKEIFTKTTPSIKGGSTSEGRSVDKAIEKYEKDFNDEFVTKILDFIQSN